MATIRKRGNTYQFTVSLGRGMDGKQIRESMTYIPTAKTSKAIEKEVHRAADDFEDAVRQGRYYTGEKITFEEFTMDFWKPQWAEAHLTLSQQEKYLFYITRYGFPTLRTLKINRVRPLHIQGIIDEHKKRLAPATIKHIVTALNSVLRYAFRMSVIDFNPCERVELPKIQQDTALHFFTRDQAIAFLNYVQEPYKSTHRAHTRTDDTGIAYQVPEYVATYINEFQFSVLYNLAIYGGFRRGELVALQWQDVDFDRNTVSVRRAFAKVQGAQILKAPKTPKSVRTVTMPAQSMDLLREWKKRQQELCLQLGTQWTGKRGTDYDLNFIFIQTGNGQAMYLDTAGQKFRKLLTRYNEDIDRKIEEGTATEEDKLPAIRFHDLRHTSATLLIAYGTDIETIAHRLGHSRVATTLDRYGHPIPENDVKAAETLERIFAV